jgi:hypothetical protein
MADVLFTDFQFAAQGAPTLRTMPVRLAEVKNVLDFGADPTGGTTSTAAIQAAVDWTSGPNRGTIFFPDGFYTVSSPITFNYDPAPGDPGLSIRFAGEGESTTIAATGGLSTTGYILDRHLATPNNTANVIIENIGFAAGAGGSIRVGSCNGVTIRNVHASGITTEDSPGNSSQGILIETCTIPGPSTGSGLTMGGSGLVENCNFTSCDVAARMYGKGWAFQTNRCEKCNTSYLIGLDSGVAATFTGSIAYAVLATFTGTITNDGVSVNTLTINSAVTGTIVIGQTIHGVGVSAYRIISGSGTSWIIEGPLQAIGPISMATDLPNDTSGVLTVASGLTGTIKPLQTVSDGGVNVAGAIIIVSQLTGSTGSTGTYRISNTPARYHSVVYSVSSQTITTIGNDVGASGFAIQTGSQESNINGVILAGTCDGFYIGSVSSLGHSNAGPEIGGYVIPTQYHLTIGPNCSNGVFQSMDGYGDMTMIAACKIYSAAIRANLVFMAGHFDRNAVNGGTGVNWDFPANAYTIQLLNCNESPTWTYSQLGTTDGVNVLEGDQFTITDGSTATWGATCTGSGGNRVLVRWNGSAYTVVGK